MINITQRLPADFTSAMRIVIEELEPLQLQTAEIRYIDIQDFAVAERTERRLSVEPAALQRIAAMLKIPIVTHVSHGGTHSLAKCGLYDFRTFVADATS